MKKIFTVLIATGMLFATACTPKEPEPVPVITETETEELPTIEICSLEKAGFSLDIPAEEIGRDPALIRASVTADVTEDYYRTISDYPIVHYGYDMDIKEEQGKYTILYSNIAGDKDVTYFPVGAFACCKTDDLGKIERKYFNVYGNYLTEAYAEQYIVDSADGWTVYDFTEIFTGGDFDTQADKLYRKNDFEEPDNSWLKDFRRTMIANRMRYIFKESYSQVETQDIGLGKYQPELLFEPVEKDKAESSVTELYFSHFSYNTWLKVPEGIDEEKITYTLDDKDGIISEWHLDHDLYISPMAFGTARITFEYEGKYQIVDVVVGDEADRAE